MYALERFDASKLEVVLFSSGIVVNAINKAQTRSLKCIKKSCKVWIEVENLVFSLKIQHVKKMKRVTYRSTVLWILKLKSGF